MAATSDKQALWGWLKQEHQALAKRLMGARLKGSEYVCITSLALESRRLVWACLQQHKPDTAAFLEGELCKDLRNIFGGIDVGLPIEDVMESILAEAPHRRVVY